MSVMRRITSGFTAGSAPVFVVLAAIFATIVIINPAFIEPGSLMGFVKKVAPLVLLAIGQYFVIVSGELDLSVGSLVGFQVVLAALLIDNAEAATAGVVLLMFGIAVVVGMVNGLVTTVLRVQSIITTLGTMLVLYGAIRLLTGGAPTGGLSETFRAAGRQGIEGIPGIGQLPWALLIAVGVAVAAVVVMRGRAGRTLMATGDNSRAAKLAGVRVWWVRTAAFVASAVLATGAAILIGGYAGVTAQVGDGLEFDAITAVVLGGVVLGGGRGAVIGAIAGAVTVEALFTLFNQLALPPSIRPAAQGLIIIAAVAYAARERGRRPSTPHPKEPAHENAHHSGTGGDSRPGTDRLHDR